MGPEPRVREVLYQGATPPPTSFLLKVEKHPAVCVHLVYPFTPWGHLSLVQLSAVVTAVILNRDIELSAHFLAFNYSGCAPRGRLFGSCSYLFLNFF